MSYIYGIIETATTNSFELYIYRERIIEIVLQLTALSYIYGIIETATTNSFELYIYRERIIEIVLQLTALSYIYIYRDCYN